MKEKFTQGDWKLNKTGPHHNNPELCNIEITYSDSGECICDTVYEEADANLIVMAKPMYRLLEEFSNMVMPTAGELYQKCEEAKMLLAKARGE